MKPAEHYNKYNFTLRNRDDGVFDKDDLLDFADSCLKEHDAEIIQIINDMIKVRLKQIKPYSLDDHIDALTELKNKLKI